MNTTTRIGKIGRLPKCCREELGRRIEDGEPGVSLVQWLNGRPDVQKVLAEQFEGRAITEQNLSDWKQGGHADWVRREEARAALTLLLEQADEVDLETEGRSLSDRFATVLAAELAQLAQLLMNGETDLEKRWQRLCEIHRTLSELRRDDHRAARTQIEQERWEREAERQDEAAAKQAVLAESRRQAVLMTAPLRKQIIADLLGGQMEDGEAGLGDEGPEGEKKEDEGLRIEDGGAGLGDKEAARREKKGRKKGNKNAGIQANKG
jgi:DNA gyrase/topoisomerase IV subunit A